jgi:ssDNA thymidine ADP-ribosyltransferase, DarT
MPKPPSPTWIYHITAVHNLPGIFASGQLISTNGLHSEGLQAHNIAYQEIQGRRALKVVTLGLGGVLHDYVPFYFAPRSPMLFTINNGNVPGCPYRQNDIVHMVSSVQKVVELGMPFVFYNYNASLAFAECFDNIEDLSKIDWPLFFETPKLGGYCKYWKSMHDNARYAQRMETRQAEFLVRDRMPLELLIGIGTSSERTRAAVEQTTRAHGVAVPVRSKPEWYY